MSSAAQKRYIQENAGRLSFDEKKNLCIMFFIANGLEGIIKEHPDSLSIDLDLINDDRIIEAIYNYVSEICRRHDMII